MTNKLHKYIDTTLRGFYNDTMELYKYDLYDFENYKTPLLSKHSKLDFNNSGYLSTIDNGKIKLENTIALDFGCGMGRWIRYFSSYLKCVDGCDISPFLVKITKQYLKKYNIKSDVYNIEYEKLDNIPDNRYDIIYSKHVFQHLPVYTLRMSYFKEFLKKLKAGGYINIECGGGEFSTNNDGMCRIANYHDDLYDIRWTNSRYDVQIRDFSLLEKDILNLGYSKVDILIKQHKLWDEREKFFAIHQYLLTVRAYK